MDLCLFINIFIAYFSNKFIVCIDLNKITSSKIKTALGDKAISEIIANRQRKASKNSSKVSSQSKNGLKNAISKNISGIEKSLNKSRNGSRKSLKRYDGREIKTFVSVLENRKQVAARLLNKSNEICSPEENSDKVKSDKVYKSSLTSSTTTHTNNVKERRNEEEYEKKRNSSWFESQLKKKKTISKIKPEWIKVSHSRNWLIKPSLKTNVTISHISKGEIGKAFAFNWESFADQNQTQDLRSKNYGDYNTIHSSNIKYKSINSLTYNKSVQNLRMLNLK